MDFTLTPDQELLRETARKLLDRECPPSVVRAHIDEPASYEPLWTHLREYMPLGAGPAADLCLFLEETGYAAAPGPFLATSLYAALTGDSDTIGTVAVLDDPVNPFVLEADRVENVAVLSAGSVHLLRRDRVEMEFVRAADFSRRLFTVTAQQTGAAVLVDRRRWVDR